MRRAGEEAAHRDERVSGGLRSHVRKRVMQNAAEQRTDGTAHEERRREDTAHRA